MSRTTAPLLLLLLCAPCWLGCGDETASQDVLPSTDILAPPDSGPPPPGDVHETGMDSAAEDTVLDLPDIGAPPSGSEGCGKSPIGLTTTLDIQGKARTFEVSVPSDYDPETPYPLVFAFHGLGGGGPLAQLYFGLKFSAEGAAIVVYPSALPLANFGGQTGWDLFPSGDDFAFFDAMHAHLMTELCVDATRVFATGHSFGGYMTNALGCHRADVLNAIAPVAGGPPSFGTCKGPIAAWITHGSADNTVPLSEGTKTRDTWLNMNGCESAASAISPSPCVAHAGCVRDVHWCEHPGGHDWPSFAGTAIWNFFSSQ